MKFIDLHCDTILGCHRGGYGLAENGGHIDVRSSRRGTRWRSFSPSSSRRDRTAG